jgi:peptidoglycan hydrolase-like protein with peptidoglycan-binding domain
MTLSLISDRFAAPAVNGRLKNADFLPVKQDDDNLDPEVVKVLQQALLDLKCGPMPRTFAKGGPDGDFGDETSEAVKRFQRKQVPPLSDDGQIGVNTMPALDAAINAFDTGISPAPAGTPDPATDPKEKERVEVLLAQQRPMVPVLILKALQELPRCKAALQLAKQSPFQAGQALRQNQVGIDGLDRHFHVSGNNLEVIDTIINSYKQLLEKVPRLPIDQAATDYPTFVSDSPENAFKKDGTPAKVPAFSDQARNKMFFNPIYRLFPSGFKDPFDGLAPLALQAIQLHEMCHFYLNMDDGDPRASNTARCLQLAQSFQGFVMQLALGRPFGV